MNIVGTKIIDTYGEVIYIKSDHPVIGLVGVSALIDSTTGTTGTNYFDKKFRLSKDGGITYSDWLTLTLGNLQAFTFTDYDIVIIEYSYQKIGPTPSSLTFNSVTLTGTNSTLIQGERFSNSIFQDFFGEYDIQVLEWCLNVTEKLYHSGILASFIDRFNDLEKPDDFLAFWRSITKFFAYYVIYARKYEKFYENEKLTREYLEQRDLKISSSNTLVELNDLMSHYNNEIFKRGTIHIIDKKTPDRDWDIGEDIDGEFLRFIDYLPEDEFLFNPYRSEHFGWNLGNCSPLHTGLEVNENINKIYETNGLLTDLSRWPITGSTLLSTDLGEDIFSISAVGGISGDVDKKYIKVDYRMDYLLTFEIKKSSTTLLTVGMDSYDINDLLISNKSYRDGIDTNLFVENTNLCTDSEYILVRCVIFNSQRPIFSSGVLNINTGNNLIINENTIKVIPRITVSGSAISAKIKNITFTPLFTTYSRGFLQVERFISTWVEKNNKSKTIQEIEDWTRKYLIPYNDNIRVTEIGAEIYIEQELDNPPVTNEYDWVGGDFTCIYEPGGFNIFTFEFDEEFV